MGRGVLIAFEGGEGSGKSTQIRLLAQALGDGVLVTCEPGGTEAGRLVRELVLHVSTPLAPRAEALLFAADRAQHVDTVLRPALERGTTVLTDRYVDSSLAYQGAGRALSMTDVRAISRFATDGLVPDLTVLLDIAAADGLARISARSNDKLEQESLAFHDGVRQAFRTLAAAEPDRYLVLDATAGTQDLATQILAAVRELVT